MNEIVSVDENVVDQLRRFIYTPKIFETRSTHSFQFNVCF